MRKFFLTLLLLITVFLFQFCSSSKKAASPNVNYQTNIQPIIQSSCAPCHIAGKGNKKSLDNYLAARDNVEDILIRIQKLPRTKGLCQRCI